MARTILYRGAHGAPSALPPIDGRKVAGVLLGSLVFLLLSGAWAYSLRSERGDDVGAWLNMGPVNARSLAVGLGTGIAFGMIDNVLLFAGIEALDGVIRRLPAGDDPVAAAAYGNAVSSTISAFGSAFVGQAIADLTGQRSSPLWSHALGVLIGGLAGIAVPLTIRRLL